MHFPIPDLLFSISEGIYPFFICYCTYEIYCPIKIIKIYSKKYASHTLPVTIIINSLIVCHLQAKFHRRIFFYLFTSTWFNVSKEFPVDCQDTFESIRSQQSYNLFFSMQNTSIYCDL